MFHGTVGAWQAPTCSQEKSSSVDEALPDKCWKKKLDSMQPPSEEGNPCSAENAVQYCLSLRGRRLSPHKKAVKIQVLRSNSCHSRCLDLHDGGRGGFSPPSFSFRMSPKLSCSQNKDTCGGVAWMTLDGLLVNVDNNAIPSEMGNILGHQEAVAWNGFAPLQKVLLVAITAAAASATKKKHIKEMRRLQLAVDAREKYSEVLREKINQLQEHLSFWKEQAQNMYEEARDKRVSSLFELGLESTPKCDSVMLEQFATPQIEQELADCFRRNLQATNFTNFKEPGAMSSTKEKKTFLDRLSESPPLIDQGKLTPQMPLTQLSKIFTPSNYVSPKQVGSLSQYCQKGCRRGDASEDLLTSYGPSTELILQLKDQISDSQTMINENCRQRDSKDERLFKESDQSLTTSGLQLQLATSDLTYKTNKEGDKKSVGSAIRLAVRNSVGNLLAPPLSGRHHFVNHSWSSDTVIHQLLGELENATAKVASMEAEINLLRNSEMLCQRKKEEAERHLAEVRLHLDMISQRRVLQSEDSMFQDLTQNEQSGFHTCKELETTLGLLKDTEQRLASCRETCERKDEAISRLEDEVASLQLTVSELRSLQATPKVVSQQDPSPMQTFLTSNLLFNLDSPIKIDSPLSVKSSFSSWKGLDELSRVSDSLERDSIRGSCDSEMSALKHVSAWQTDENNEEPECITSELQVERAATIKYATIREESRRNRSNEGARRSNSNREQRIRRSNGSSSTDESSFGPVRHGQLPQLPKSYTSHARKLKFLNAADSQLPEDNGRRKLSPVELNTPMREGKFNSGSKDKNLSHHQSLDSLNKAKENFAHRRRWM